MKNHGEAGSLPGANPERGAVGDSLNVPKLVQTATALVAGDKGLLAMDESNPTCNARFAKLGIPQTEESRRAYRELIVTTAGLNESISGAIHHRAPRDRAARRGENTAAMDALRT